MLVWGLVVEVLTGESTMFGSFGGSDILINYLVEEVVYGFGDFEKPYLNSTV